MATLQTKTIDITSSGLTTATTAYTAGDMLGPEYTLSGAAFYAGGEGYITGLQIVDKAKIIGGTDWRFFDAAASPAADNAANSWADANAITQVASCQLPAPVTSALNGQAYLGNLWLPYKCASGSTSLYMSVITLTGHTFFGAVGDLVMRVYLAQWV